MVPTRPQGLENILEGLCWGGPGAEDPVEPLAVVT